jgi:hypothetical protein
LTVREFTPERSLAVTRGVSYPICRDLFRQDLGLKVSVTNVGHLTTGSIVCVSPGALCINGHDYRPPLFEYDKRPSAIQNSRWFIVRQLSVASTPILHGVTLIQPRRGVWRTGPGGPQPSDSATRTRTFGHDRGWGFDLPPSAHNGTPPGSRRRTLEHDLGMDSVGRNCKTAMLLRWQK